MALQPLLWQKLASVAFAFVLLANSVMPGSAVAQDSEHRLGIYIGLAVGFNNATHSARFGQLARLLSEHLAGELRQAKSVAAIESIKPSDLELGANFQISLLSSDLKAFFDLPKVQSYLSEKRITHMLVGVVEPPNSQGQVIQWKFADLQPADGGDPQIHRMDLYSGRKAELSSADIHPATQRIIDYLIQENPSIAKTKKVFASCFLFMGSEENSRLKNYLFQLPLEITLKISVNPTGTDLRTRGYDVIMVKSNDLFLHCGGDAEQAGKLYNMAVQRHRAEYIISGYGLEMGPEFWLHLQIEKPKVDVEAYHFEEKDKVDSYKFMGDRLAAHILDEWDNIIDTLDRKATP